MWYWRPSRNFRHWTRAGQAWLKLLKSRYTVNSQHVVCTVSQKAKIVTKASFTNIFFIIFSVSVALFIQTGCWANQIKANTNFKIECFSLGWYIQTQTQTEVLLYTSRWCCSCACLRLSRVGSLLPKLPRKNEFPHVFRVVVSAWCRSTGPPWTGICASNDSFQI